MIEPQEDSRLQLTTEDGRSVVITVLGRQNTESQGYWDGNWLEAHVSVVGKAFQGMFGISLLVQELAALQDRIEHLRDGRIDRFEFRAMENSLSFGVEMQATGGYLLREMFGAVDELAEGLEFRWVIEESALTLFGDQIRAVLQRYEVLGQPDGSAP